MRYLFVIALLLASPATAWEFRPVPICTLAQSDEIDVKVTYDAVREEYAIALTRNGPAPLTISTDRHQINGDTLIVTDRGFGNVLKGMEGNFVATAITGPLAVPITLAGAAPEVAKFRACTEAIGV